jgi:malonyl-CoA decarboxylase
VAPDSADTAIFYSISNAQQGLMGISFGNFLIKRVVESLKTELPNIRTFSTLSPVPGFSRWLQGLTQDEMNGLVGEEGRAALNGLADETELSPRLIDLLGQPGWHMDESFTAVVQPLLQRLLFHYFHAKRSDGQPIDPVERFHLGNGARIERVNWLGDVSDKGFAQAYGFMVNYLYPIKEIEKNHELYATKRKIVVSSAVRALK